MKIEKFPFQAKEQTLPGQRIEGQVTIPQGSKIVHINAEPPRGELYMYCEVSPVNTPDVIVDLTVLQVGEEIPTGYVYRGYILAVPILFVYERKQHAIIT